MIAEEIFLALLGLLYLAFAVLDIYVARRLLRAARVRPAIDALNAAALIALAITAGAVIGALLGLNGVYHAATGESFIPVPVALTLLAVALGIPSVANVYLLRLLRRWDGDIHDAHLHMRNHEPMPRYHRRRDDGEA